MPHRFARLALSLALLCAPVGPSFAQMGPDEDEDEIGEPAQPQARAGRQGQPAREDRADREAARRKAAACRSEATRQNLRGPEARDFASICVAEARLTCLKRAVETKVGRGQPRRDYIAKCLGEI